MKLMIPILLLFSACPQPPFSRPSTGLPDVKMSHVSIASFSKEKKVSTGFASEVEFFREGERAGNFVAHHVSGTSPIHDLSWNTKLLNGNIVAQEFENPEITHFTYGPDTSGQVRALHFSGTMGSEGSFFSDAGIEIKHPKHAMTANTFVWDLATGNGTFEHAVTSGVK